MERTNDSLAPVCAERAEPLGQASSPRRNKKRQNLLIGGTFVLWLGMAVAYFVCSARADRQIGELRKMSDRVMRSTLESGRSSPLP